MKIAIEKHFADNWTATPIHWQGMRFTAPSDNKWIHVSFTPISRQRGGFGGGCATNEAQVKIMSYDKTPTASLALDGQVLTFLENYSWEHNSTVGLSEPDGLGTIDMENGAFETSSLYQVKSTTVPQPITKTVTHNGLHLTIHGKPITITN